MKIVKYIFILILFTAVSFQTFSKTVNSDSVYAYPILVKDNLPRLFTMRQFNTTYLSANRFIARELNNSLPKKYSLLLQAGLSFFNIPLSHEEGHRSVLTYKNIGSISRPYSTSKGAAYVMGVTDQALQNLRDTDLPTFVRLHNGGLESDFMIVRRLETIAAFKQDEYWNIYIELLVRKFALFSYFFTSQIPSISIDLDEEANELDRDIVGHDVYGATRHLFRPAMNYYRYTNYEHLSGDEKKFIKRVANRSLLNLISPLLLNRPNFKLSENLEGTFGLGYCMAPFGDFIDENIWLRYKEKTNLHLYFRQFQNRNTWSNGGGLSINRYPITKKIYTTIGGHFWMQPKNLDFNTSDIFTGGAIDVLAGYKFFSKTENGFKALSFDLGYSYKTYGFLPEELYLEEKGGLRFGMTFFY